MSECTNCGGFVTDAYARVFGDNDDRVHECRHCPSDATGSTDEGTDERQVFLSEVRGGDVGDDDAEDQAGSPTPGGVSADGESTDETNVGPDDGTCTDDERGGDAHGPGTEDQEADAYAPVADDRRNRSGLSAILSSLRS